MLPFSSNVMPYASEIIIDLMILLKFSFPLNWKMLSSSLLLTFIYNCIMMISIITPTQFIKKKMLSE